MASKVDPNLYSLSIELSLSTAAAFASIDQLSAKLTSFESDVTAAAEKSLKSILTIADQTQQAVVNLGKELEKINAISTQHVTTLPKITKETDNQCDLTNKQLKAIEKIDKLEQKITKEHQKLDKLFESEKKFLEEEEKLLRSHDDLHGRIGDKRKTADGASAKAIISLESINHLLRGAEKESERFVTSNYRMYDSIYGLLGRSRELAATQGVMYEEAVETYAALGNLQLPQDELDKYATSVAKASRYLGVAKQTLAEFSNRLMGAGGNAQMAERQFVFMSEAMRKLGLNSADVSRIMGNTAISAHLMHRYFGDNNETAANTMIRFQQLEASMTGYTKSIGFVSGEMSQFQTKLLTNTDAMLRFSGAAGMNIDSADKLGQAYLKIGQDAEKMFQKQIAAGVGTKIAMESVAEVYGMTATEMEMLTQFAKKARTEMGITGAIADDARKLFDRLRTEGLDPTSQANATFGRQLDLLKTKFVALANKIWTFIGERLMPLVRAINEFIEGTIKAYDDLMLFWKAFKEATILGTIIDLFGVLSDKISQFINWVDKLPVIGKAFRVVRGASAIVLGLVVAMAALAAVMVLLAAKTFIFSLITKGIWSMATAVGGGLKIIGTSVKTVMVPLLVLGAVFMMVGIGAYFFAAGIAQLTDRWWQAILIIPVFTAAIIAMIIALSRVAQAVANPKVLLGLAAISLALIAIAFSVWLASEGIETIAKSIKSVAEVASLKLLTFLMGLGLTLAFLSLFSPLIGIFATAIFLLGLALRVVEGPVKRFLAVIAPLAGEMMPKLSAALRELTASVSGSIRELAIVAPLLMVAAVELGVGAAELGVAGVVLLAAGVSLDSAMIMLGPAAVLLVGVGDLLKHGSASIMEAGPNLITGATALQHGVNILNNVNGLFRAVSLLIPGAELLDDLGSALIVSGKRLHAGAKWVWVAGQDLQSGTLAILESVNRLANISGVMITIGPDLLLASRWLLRAGSWLSSAGFQLVMASTNIAVGLMVIGAAIDKFTPFIGRLLTIATALMMLATAFSVINVAPANGLRDMADVALGALPNIERAGDGLIAAVAKLDAGIAGLNIADDVGKFGESLERYAMLLENAAERINIAVMTKAIPAMRAAEQAGLKEAIRSEAIHTVQILTDNDGRARDDETNGWLREIASRMRNVDEKMNGLPGKENAEIADLLALLKDYLPSLAQGTSGFGSELTNWGR